MCEWFGFEHAGLPGGGHSLWPLLRGDARSVRDELLIGSPSIGWRLQTGEFACVCGPAVALAEPPELSSGSTDHPRLFVKPDDARDTLDVARDHPDVTDRMLERIRQLAPRRGRT
jgi:hypothetical protein